MFVQQQLAGYVTVYNAGAQDFTFLTVRSYSFCMNNNSPNLKATSL